MTKRVTKGSPPRFRVGERVRMRHGWEGVEVVILEDRGIITLDGQRVYTIKMMMEEEPVLDWPEDELVTPAELVSTTAQK